MYSRQICRDTFFGFHKKNEKGKEKVVFQGEGIQKVVVQLPYTWGYVDSINRIRRSKLKVKIVVEVGGNQNAISGGMGRVFLIETPTMLFGGTLFLQPDRPCFFQSLGEKNKKQKFVTRNPGDRMGVSGYGSFFCTWAVRACPAQGRMFTEPWATPPTAGAMKIERGVVYDPTIHHWLC